MKTNLSLASAAALLLCASLALADEAPAMVKIKKWKADPVELMERPGGAVVETRPAADLPGEAERTGQGFLKVKVGDKEYYVDASQARTDLKLSGKPKCDNIGGANGYAASRGLGEEGCEP